MRDLPEQLDRFEVDADTGRWVWQGPRIAGYGRSSTERSFGTIRAHRAMYMFYRGEIGEGLVLDHLCRNRGCVNPDHLEPVENVENIMRGVDARNGCRSLCPQGHEMAGWNLKVPLRGGWKNRYCVTCVRIRMRWSQRERRGHPHRVPYESWVEEAAATRIEV